MLTTMVLTVLIVLACLLGLYAAVVWLLHWWLFHDEHMRY